MASYEERVNKNLIYLIDHLKNFEVVLLHCIQRSLISSNDKELIKSHIGIEKEWQFFNTLKRNDWNICWEQVREIFLLTGNEHLVRQIESTGLELGLVPTNVRQLAPKRLSKCWPDEKRLVNAFYERKVGEVLLVDEIHNKLLGNENGKGVINRSVVVSGLGGIGKTTTAKWYASKYKNEYDHIFWIDCGEGSFSKSFHNLAHDIGVDTKHNSNDLRTLTRKCYEKQSQFKCLWIFDNAEVKDFLGPNGIRDILPNIDTYYSIITSTCQEWGTENGHGIIFPFPLETFTKDGSVCFLKEHLRKNDRNTDEDFSALCEELGNLPLALQIAISAINKWKIPVRDYIERIQNSPLFTHQRFEDYERTINMAMNISLERIKSQEQGNEQIAYKILQVFSYLTPSDVPLEFFQAIEQNLFYEVQEAILLLENYSLLTRTMSEESAGAGVSLSIHRLLQRVIRSNEIGNKNDILRKIFNSKGYLEYKLLPFNYADEQLKKEYVELQAQLVQQLELRKLLNEGQYPEAMTLAKIVDDTLRTANSSYNYAVCCEKYNKKKDASAIFESLYENVGEAPTDDIQDDIDDTIGIVDLQYPLHKRIVAAKLFFVYADEGCLEKIQGIIRQENPLLIPYGSDNLNIVIDKLSSLDSYSVKCRGMWIKISLPEVQKTKQMFLYNCQIRDNILPNDLTDLTLINVDFIDSCNTKLSKVNIDNCIGLNISTLHLDSSGFGETLPFKEGSTEDDWQNYQRNCTELVFPLKDISRSMNKIFLVGCTLLLNTNKSQLKALHVHLENVEFYGAENVKIDDPVEINDFLAFGEITTLSLISWQKRNMLLKLIGVVNLDFLHMYSVSVLDWTEASWTIEKLELLRVPIYQSKMNIKNLKIRYSSVDPFFLPQSLVTLTLGKETGLIKCSQQLCLPNLQYFCKTMNANENVDFFQFFSCCENLNNICLEAVEELDLDLIPKAVHKLSLTQMAKKDMKISGLQEREIDTLIIRWSSFEELDSILCKLRPKNLVFESKHFICDYSDPRLMELLERPIDSISVGEFDMSDGLKNPIFSSLVDKDAKYYTFVNKVGKGLEASDFKQLMSMGV